MEGDVYAQRLVSSMEERGAVGMISAGLWDVGVIGASWHGYLYRMGQALNLFVSEQREREYLV